MILAIRPSRQDSLYFDPLIYDLEHDAVRGDLRFYRRVCRQALPGAVLEAGAGTGRLARILACEGRRVDALEREPAMIQRALGKQRGDEENGVHWIQGDLLHYRGRAGGYALALLAYNTVQHFSPDTLPGCLETLHYHLAPGGFLALDCFAPATEVMQASRWQDPVERLGPGGEIWRVELRQELSAAWLTTRYRVSLRRPGARAFVELRQLQVRRYQWAAEDLRRTLIQAGFAVVESFGDLDLRPLKAGSPRYLFVARRVVPEQR